MNRRLRALLQQVAAYAKRRRLAGVIDVGLEGKPKHRQQLARHRAEQVLHYQPRNPVLMPGVESHNALPVIDRLWQT